jgi:galactose mutarotase-like enzyme
MSWAKREKCAANHTSPVAEENALSKPYQLEASMAHRLRMPSLRFTVRIVNKPADQPLL